MLFGKNNWREYYMHITVLVVDLFSIHHYNELFVKSCLMRIIQNREYK